MSNPDVPYERFRDTAMAEQHTQTTGTENAMFDHILNWRLLSGSHKFPGPDGGTCINEAAIIAAGFEYRSVNTVRDCPPCFSRPIAAYALALNDKMPGVHRQKLLMPFVARLAGTADRPEIESARIRLIVFRTKKEIGGTSADAAAAAAAAADAAADATYAAAYAAYAAYADAAAAADADADAAYAAAYAAACASAAADTAYTSDAARIWQTTVSILDEAIRLGKQSEPIEIALVVNRMERAKVRAENERA